MSSGLIDLGFAARVAARFASAGPVDPTYFQDDLDRHFAELVAEAEPHIARETGFHCPEPAVAEVLTRSEWAENNIESMTQLMSPLLERVEQKMARTPGSDFARMAYRPALGAQLGGVLGFLSRRVLGQYDLLKGHENRVWFVGPNIVATEKRFGFVPRDFRMWVTLHELTHRAQFEGNPWLRAHFLESVGQMLGGFDLDGRFLIERILDGLKGKGDGAPLGIRMLGPKQRAMFDKLQAFMTVIEGHGNFIMDRVGEDTIPTQSRMREALRSGGGPSGNLLTKILWKLLGLEMKKAQYDRGQKFFDGVFAIGGSRAVGLAFAGPQNLPTLTEIEEPARWLERVDS